MTKAVDHRRRDLAKIHVGKKQLALSDEDYRALLWSVARVKSAGDLDSNGRHRVIEHMVSRGFKPRAKGRTRPARDRELMVAKIRALLINDIEGPLPDNYADAIARQMFKVQRFEWCKPDQLHKIIQSLEVRKNNYANRSGVASQILGWMADEAGVDFLNFREQYVEKHFGKRPDQLNHKEMKALRDRLLEELRGTNS